MINVLEQDGLESVSNPYPRLTQACSGNGGIHSALASEFNEALCNVVNSIVEVRIKEVYIQTVIAFLNAIDLKDRYTKNHSLRVAEMAAVVAKEIGFDEHEIEGIYFAGLIHDIGKIAVDPEILNKPGGLDLAEYAEMSRHAQVGAEIISHIEFPWENVAQTILHHHDTHEPGRWREAGFHRIATRIIRLIDAFDAMTSDRPYRRALSLTETVREIAACTPSQFDPEVALVFMEILKKDLHAPVDQRRVLKTAPLNGHAAMLLRINLACQKISNLLDDPDDPRIREEAF